MPVSWLYRSTVWNALPASDADSTPDGTRFFQELSRRVPGLDEWYHADADGTLWMCVSFDFVTSNVITATLRLDWDGHSLRGGWSPAP